MTDKPESKELKTIREIIPNSFIFEKMNALPADLCDEMIRRFEAREDEQYPGRIGQTVSSNQSIKKTTDLVVSGKPDWKDIDHLARLFLNSGKSTSISRGPSRIWVTIFSVTNQVSIITGISMAAAMTSASDNWLPCGT
jgi:hypothetical protein